MNAKTWLLLFLLLPISIALSADALVIDTHAMNYNANGKDIRHIIITNTGDTPVTITKGFFAWNSPAQMKELKLGEKLWVSTESSTGESSQQWILLTLNATIPSNQNEELRLKFDASVANNFSRMHLELDDGSSVFVKILEGYVRGTMDYQITDGDTIIAKYYAKNTHLYVVPQGFMPQDLSLIKQIPYQGNTTLDADQGDTRCSEETYVTKQYYYDTNNNNKNALAEPLIYSVQTNEQGCYAFTIPEGNYDILT